MLAAAIVSLGLWAVLLVAIAVLTRPRVGDVPAPSMDLPGDESPALVNLLTNGFQMTRAAVPATLLDLAARGHVAIQHIAGDDFVLRLDDGGEDDLVTGYEAQVLDHVQSLAHNGEVPGAALTTGPPDHAEAWWKRFRKQVVAEARGRKLSRPRWGRGLRGALVLAALIPSYLAARGVFGRTGDEAWAVTVWMGIGLSAPLSLLRKERDTPAGRAQAGKWLAVRRFLADDPAFCEQPPGGVNIWDRYLAYGAAMGVARGAVKAMPMGSESATEAWSPYGGQWHVVRVDYPKWVPPGWGAKPSSAVLTGLLGMVPIAFILFVFVAVLASIVDEFARGWALVGVAVFGVHLLLISVVGFRFLGMAVLGLLDLGAAKREVTGRVVRMREVLIKNKNRTYSVQHYVAVDDGQSAEVDAWLVGNEKLNGIRPGVVVDATVTPRLGYVERIGIAGSERSSQ